MSQKNTVYIINLLRDLIDISHDATKLRGTLFVDDGLGGKKEVIVEFRQVIRHFRVFIDVYIKLDPRKDLSLIHI